MHLEHNIAEQKQHKYYNEKISGYEIDLKVDQAAHTFAGCEISDCVIRINCGSTIAQHVLSNNTWKNCTLWPNREMSLPTIEADFEECQFKGKWSLRFGGVVESCDFTSADLVYAAFYKNDRIRENQIIGGNTLIIEDLRSKYTEIKERLSGKSRFGILISPEMRMLALNIEKQKDSDILRDLLKEYT